MQAHLETALLELERAALPRGQASSEKVGAALSAHAQAIASLLGSLALVLLSIAFCE